MIIRLIGWLFVKLMGLFGNCSGWLCGFCIVVYLVVIVMWC